MSRKFIVERCDNCPIRVKKESHGPSDSSYWVECGMTSVVLRNECDGELFKSKFPSSCQLQENEVVTKKFHLDIKTKKCGNCIFFGPHTTEPYYGYCKYKMICTPYQNSQITKLVSNDSGCESFSERI